MARRMIEIRTGPNGEIEIEGFNFPDNSCFAHTKPYEDAIGTKVSVIKKPEAHRKARVKVKKSVGVPSGYCG